MLIGYIFLTIAICSESIGAAMLKVSNGFKKWKPSALVVIGYSLAFYMLSLTLNHIPLSLSYASWSGVGTVLTAVIGVKWFKEELNVKGLIGILLLISGVVLLNWQ
ncbi:multidrug efflux SMR transporter subunit EbrA [Bacillus inaquosorum]|uniref:Multidrug efflux SMR transporter subunit EbrA n=1 Tax=Bacillus inaquosorum TaxID=483913 RepID=A0A9Q4EPW3_9BACI|nr:multidrug efflux SMR transporter subunit EbrA [Bacillus inaquosorum]MCY7785586.1 multidrug efflux SMR transporter subunit EbrA [Bacillus inaquosorum]MCY7818809.1 multidrug efflux SMR transporter subunit EbrA [Bacillus inaquosorum]MCY7939437.1 multidrug efflux SMR transporter subunit EbrA [Bacillus inaquosorum]MCY7940513.1 multidrug efflux SMR transporter subunit EbrA [Bacillus inaquosorum]MCY8083049.1 multidrug efflux SMR transporter subunit EbrA [Bacillus inaquosorum]